MDEIERINALRDHLEKTIDQLAMETGVGTSRWKNIFSGRAKVRLEDINALRKAYPEFGYWLAFGEELPEAGQISPMTKSAQESYKKRGGDS